MRLKQALLSVLALALFTSAGFAQTGTLKGTVTDQSGQTLIGVNVVLLGTYKGTVTNYEGKYKLTGIKPGEYTVKFSYVGYTELKAPGTKIEADKEKVLDVTMKEFVQQTETVTILGKKSMVDLESATSRVSIGAADIKDMNTNDVQDVVKMQAGVSESPDGIQIRGARVYETNYVIDGVSAKDPLSGTGFGVQVASNSVQSIDLITGGGDAEYSDATGGVIITKVKEGGDSLEAYASWQRDNLGWANGFASWNTDILDFSLGGPLTKNKKLKFYTGVNFQLTDNFYQKWAEEDRGTWNEISANLSDAPTEEFYNARAGQLRSSILDDRPSVFGARLGSEGGEFFAPRQNNTWSNTIKLSYELGVASKLTFTQQNSFKVNQSTNTLQIVGNDQVVTPGYQYFFGNELDNASTFTHKAYLTALNYSINFNERYRLELTGGRLFVHLRGDANGRSFRVPPGEQENFSARSITNMPASVFDTTTAFSTPQRLVLRPTSGLMNNGGISGLWHDHYVQEYTGKAKLLAFSKNEVHTISTGWEHKEQEMQWIDVSSPWIGAPVEYTDRNGTTQITPNQRIGRQSEVWQVRPATGSIFASDEINYNGLKAVLGGMFKYWAPGSFIDKAVENPAVQLPQQLKDNYKESTSQVGNRRFKARFLPNVNVTFPVTENNIMYFNYGHSMILPHPRFLYTGLDPQYTQYSDFTQVGNPNLNPEVSVSYELGYKSQITNDIGFTATAFYNDRFDYIVRSTIVTQTAQGEESRSIFINQDYARIRGVELGYNQRIIDWFKVFANFGYQVATGKSNGANEAELLGLDSRASLGATEEQFLAWDRPFDFKTGVIFRPDTNLQLFGQKLNGLRAFFTAQWKSGLRYTEHVYSGEADNGRPLYTPRQDTRFNKVGSNWFWADIKVSYDTKLYKKLIASFSVEVKNIFNNRNAQRINPVTGEAYQAYDNVPEGWRDPNPVYLNPQQSGLINGLSPDRFRQPRQLIFGVTLRY